MDKGKVDREIARRLATVKKKAWPEIVAHLLTQEPKPVKRG